MDQSLSFLRHAPSCLWISTPIQAAYSWVTAQLSPRDFPLCPLWKWKWSRSVVSDSLWPHGLTIAYQALPSMVFSRQEYWKYISSSRRSSRPKGWTQVSHIVGRRFNVWATREVRVIVSWISCLPPSRCSGVHSQLFFFSEIYTIIYFMFAMFFLLLLH